jgi:hypothetical protein
MTSKHKSEDYKLSAVEYYLVGDKSQLEVCEIFKCSPRSLRPNLYSIKKSKNVENVEK